MHVFCSFLVMLFVVVTCPVRLHFTLHSFITLLFFPSFLYLFFYNLISRLCHFYSHSFLSLFLVIYVVYVSRVMAVFSSSSFSVVIVIVLSLWFLLFFRFIMLSEGNFIRMADLLNAMLLSFWPFACTFKILAKTLSIYL